MPGEKIGVSVGSSDMNAIHTEKEIVNIDEFTERVCYFSLAGDLALNAFGDRFSTFRKDQRRERMKAEFERRLHFAILMFDKVIMHCSDPLRSDIVLEVLEDNLQWVKTGRILFIFSKHINDIKKDYKEYIDSKIKDYSEGYRSEKEAESLQKPHINNGYYDRVIKVLEATDFLVRKSKENNCSFDKLVINDLNAQFQAENVIVDSYADLSQILSLNLSIFQLLHMRHIKCKGDEEKEVGRFVFSPQLVNDVIDGIKDSLEQGNVISRSAIVDSLEDEFKKNKGKSTKLQRNVLKAVTLRMDVLYCKMNSGKQLILEFHPSYESRSNYQIDCFDEYLRILCGGKERVKLTQDKINKILTAECLQHFRYGYLCCMADMREHIKLTQLNESNLNQYKEKMVELFRSVAEHNQVLDGTDLSSIRNILKEAV